MYAGVCVCASTGYVAAVGVFVRGKRGQTLATCIVRVEDVCWPHGLLAESNIFYIGYSGAFSDWRGWLDKAQYDRSDVNIIGR